MSPPVGGRRLGLLAAGMAAGLVLAGLTAPAAHAAPVSGTVSVEKAVDVPANSGIAHSVSCPAGRFVTGGGFSIPQPALADTLQVRESRPIPSGGWRVAVRSTDPLPRTVKIYALCSSGPRPTYLSKAITVPANSNRSDKVTCPSGSIAGGGFATDVQAPMTGAKLNLPASTNEWFLSVVNTASYERTARIYAVCADVTGLDYALRAQVVAPGESYSLIPACPSGKVPTSGGFLHNGPPTHLWSSIPVPSARGWAFSYRVPGTAQQNYAVITYAVCVTGT